jgi:hypothetical protein
MEWWTSAVEVNSVANALVDAGLIDNIKDLLYFYAKPWKWDLERKYLQEHGTLDSFNGEVSIGRVQKS